MRLTVTIVMSAFAVACSANNIQVGNTTLTGNTGTSVMVQFDLSWENSWRGGGVANWDAAWVFVKFRTPSGFWNHVSLNNTGHVAPVGSQIDPGLLYPGTVYDVFTNPVMGVFIYRNSSGNGTLNLPAVQLNWNYGSLGMGINDIAQVEVFAIEMVYVPQSAFYVGSGGTESGSFTDGAWTGGSTIPLQITSENALPIAQSAGALWGTSNTGANTIGGAGTLPAAFPKGFAAFYCMKYELSQQAYVDFLNTLTYSQQVTKTTTAPTSAAGTGALESNNQLRNGIDIQTPGVASATPAVYACNLDGDGTYGEAVDGKDIACGDLSWNYSSAYLDWSGLRLMTELEYEKASRGPIFPAANDYPWGTPSIGTGIYGIGNAGANNEGVSANYSTTLGNAGTTNTLGPSGASFGPLRGGIFAANGSSTGRVTAGASYYGIMELCGNLFERPVTIGNVTGRAYTGTHGNGILTTTGYADPSNWPYTSVAGFRGGSFDRVPFPVSDRTLAVSANGFANYDYGCRGVRSAP